MKYLITLVVVMTTIFAQIQSEMAIAKYIKNKLQFQKYVSPPAQFALIAFENKEIAPVLLECLAIKRRRKDNISVRYHLIRKLAQFEYEPAIEEFVRVLKEKNDPWWVKAVAVDALLKLNYNQKDTFFDLLDTESIFLKKKAIITLQKITKEKEIINSKSSIRKVKKAIKYWKKKRKKNTKE